MSANFRWKGTSPPTILGVIKLRVFLLPNSEDRVILPSFVWIGYQCVTRRTDRQTEGIAVANTVLCIASNAATL